MDGIHQLMVRRDIFTLVCHHGNWMLGSALKDLKSVSEYLEPEAVNISNVII